MGGGGMGPISDTGMGGSGSCESVKVLGCRWRSAGGAVTSLVVGQSDAETSSQDIQFKCSKTRQTQTAVITHYGGGGRGIAPLILNLATTWRQVITSRPGSFTARKETRYPLNRRLGEHFGDEKNLLTYQDSNPGPCSP